MTKGKRLKVVRFLISPNKKKVKIEVNKIMNPAFLLGTAFNIAYWHRKYHSGTICKGVSNPQSSKALSVCEKEEIPIRLIKHLLDQILKREMARDPADRQKFIGKMPKASTFSLSLSLHSLSILFKFISFFFTFAQPLPFLSNLGSFREEFPSSFLLYSDSFSSSP